MKLETIELTFCEVNASKFSNLINGKETEIGAISFEGSTFDEDFLAYLTKNLDKFPHLEYVVLQDIRRDFSKFDETKVASFFKKLITKISITHLNLQGCGLSNNIAELILTNMTENLRWAFFFDNADLSLKTLNEIGVKLEANTQAYNNRCTEAEIKRKKEKEKENQFQQVSEKLKAQVRFLEEMEAKSKSQFEKRKQQLKEAQIKEQDELVMKRLEAEQKQEEFMTKKNKKKNKKKKK